MWEGLMWGPDLQNGMIPWGLLLEQSTRALSPKTYEEQIISGLPTFSPSPMLYSVFLGPVPLESISV